MHKKSYALIATMLITVLLLSSCDNAGNTTDPDNSSASATSEQSSDPNNYQWTIKINDTSTVKMGDIDSTTTLNITAKNDKKGIIGQYSGNGSGNTVNVNSAYGSSSQAGSETGLQWNFSIDYPLAPLTDDANSEDNAPDPLAPLVPEENDDSLAPLVRDESGDVAPLTPDGLEADYEGAGTMTMVPRTATVSGAGTSTKKEMGGVSYPTNIYIIGNKVRLELKTPQGSVFFDGTLQEESA